MTLLPRSAPVVALAALALGAAAVSLERGDAAAQEVARPAAEETVREKVERLFPDLLSESAPARQRAERELIALGEPARAELDRLTRDPDPKKAIAAVKLLNSDRWGRERSEERAARDESGSRRRDRHLDIENFRDEIDQRVEEMRRRLEQWERDFRPEDWFRDWAPEMNVEVPRGVRGRSSGTVVENDRSLSWTVEESGKVKVTVKDGEGRPETTYEAESLDELRRQHPDVAKRLDGYLPRAGGRRFVFSWPSRSRDGRDATPGLRDGEEPLEPFDAPVAAPGPVLGIGAAPVPDVLREQLGLPADGGMVVDTVAPGSLAAKLGMRRHDVLLTVAGRTVAGPPDVRKALESVATGANVDVVIVRKGKTQTLTGTR